MHKFLLIGIMVMGFSFNALATFKMKIANLCNISSQYWRVQIYNGNYIENIASDGSFETNVPSGTKLSAFIGWEYCAQKYPLEQSQCIQSITSVRGAWTPAAAGGILPVRSVSSKYIDC